MSDPALRWSSAEVREGKLSVDLEGDAPRGWRASFEATVRLLGGGDWGQLKLKKRTISVVGVTPGSEDKLRHFLESVVQQANASHRPQDEAKQKGDGRDGEKSRAEDSADSRMTEQFRSFGEDEPPQAEAES